MMAWYRDPWTYFSFKTFVKFILNRNFLSLLKMENQCHLPSIEGNKINWTTPIDVIDSSWTVLSPKMSEPEAGLLFVEKMSTCCGDTGSQTEF